MNDTTNINLIPSELKPRPQWVNWEYEQRQNNDYAKVPYSPVTGQRADVSNPATWGTFDQAVERANSAPGQIGIGFVFTPQDPYCGIDLDNCINPDTGIIEPWALNIITSISSYTEISPSGLGVKIFIRGKLPPGRRRKGQIEFYDANRYFTITGNHLPGTPITIEERQGVLAALHAQVFGENTQKTQGVVASLTPQDDALIEQAQTAMNGKLFDALMKGEWKGLKYLSQSEADLALCALLAYWTRNDEKRIDNLFRCSGLFRPKWDELRGDMTYGRRTIKIATNVIKKPGANFAIKDKDTVIVGREPIEISQLFATSSTSIQVSNKTLEESISSVAKCATTIVADSTSTQVGAAVVSPNSFHRTEQGNAQRLVARYGAVIRHCPKFDKWLFWDGTRWLFDETGAVMRLAKETVRMMYVEAGTIIDENSRKEAAKWAWSSDSMYRLTAMVALAKSESGISINPDQLDADPFLLNCTNGTIDLRTQTLYQPNPNNYITKCTHIEYALNAQCPHWEEFLDYIMEGNQEMISFLKRICGYILTGDTSEQCFFIFIGIGANGKTTFTNVSKILMGDYAKSIPADTLMIKRNSGGPNPELASLRGARLVLASESEEGQRLAESSIKQLTGEDTIMVRGLYQAPFQMKPNFKIILSTNHKPRIYGNDHAIWRRVHLVGFNVTIPPERQNKAFASGAIFREELPGIMNWMLEGLKEYQERGRLDPPESVRAATQAYREQEDTFGQWLTECCIEDSQHETPVKELYECYCSWSVDMGLKPMSQKSFGTKLGERGFSKDRRKEGRFSYQGIALTRPIQKEYLWQCRLSNNPDVWQPWLQTTNDHLKVKQLLTEIYGQNSVLEVALGWLKVR